MMAKPTSESTSKIRKSKAERREIILDEAEALLAARSFPTFSLQAVARRLGLTNNALYYYFVSRDEILLRLGVRCYEALTRQFEHAREQAAGAPGIDQVTRMGRAFFQFTKKNPTNTALLHQTGGPPFHLGPEEVEALKPAERAAFTRLKQVEGAFARIWITTVARGQEDGSIRPELPASTLAILLGMVTSGVVTELGHLGSQFVGKAPSEEDLVGALFTILRAGLEPPIRETRT